MKRFLLTTAAALLIGTAAANAYEMNCGAPVVAIGDDVRDNNPVVGTDIQYFPDNHEWRVFHNLQNGLVVSRGVQYAMLDATNDHKVQWQGSLNRNRSLYMVGELRRVEGHVVYMEWIYNRSHGNALEMQSTAQCQMALPRPAPLPRPTS